MSKKLDRAIAALERAAEGDSNDAEIDAASELRDVAEAEVARLERQVELLNKYGEAKFGDEWWPGNAEPWVGKDVAREMNKVGISQK